MYDGADPVTLSLYKNKKKKNKKKKFSFYNKTDLIMKI